MYSCTYFNSDLWPSGAIRGRSAGDRRTAVRRGEMAFGRKEVAVGRGMVAVGHDLVAIRHDVVIVGRIGRQVRHGGHPARRLSRAELWNVRRSFDDR